MTQDTTPPISVLDVLVRARTLIADPADWWPGVLRAAIRRHTNCALTAIGTATSELTEEYATYDSVVTLLDTAEAALAAQFPESVRRSGWPSATIVAANDTLGHTAVLAAYDAAIEAARQSDAAR